MNYRFQASIEVPLLSRHLKMGGENLQGETICVNNRYLVRDGKPWIPVMGEYQFARAHKEDWKRELAKMKAGGITVVSSYLIWLYHEEVEGEMDFTGDLDLRAFVLACKDAGMEVLLRIGPWIHGECRNGGFPDWLMEKGYPLREDHPEYLAQVKRWYSRIMKEIDGLLYKDGGNIIGVQLENELQYNGEHLGTLKKLALECGIEVPIYTVTGWSVATAGAIMPRDEFLPVFGGYCEAPWERKEGPMEPSVHYFFTYIRNDSSIGSDSHVTHEEDERVFEAERYPYATCELGGGIPMSHHRRAIVKPMDIYALALSKLGDGNHLPGYYLYHGGSNKIGKLSTFQESIATRYPNDYPIVNYDFQAPLSEYGESRAWYGLLNMQNLFVRDFQEEFAVMQTAPAERDPERMDVESLRYVMQTDGESGFVFVNHYQRLTKLADLEEVVFDTGNVVFPPITVKGEVAFFLPFRMKMGQAVLECATAQPICKYDDTYFFAEIPGIDAVYRLEDGREEKVTAGKDSVFVIGDKKIVTLTWEEAKYLRKLEEGKVYLGEGCDIYWYEGKVQTIQDGLWSYYSWEDDKFVHHTIGQPVEDPHVRRIGVKSAPFDSPCMDELQIEGTRKVTWEKVTVDSPDGFVEIADCCDVAQIYADGTLVADNFYYGKPWRVPAKLLFDKECYLAMSEMKEDFYREFEMKRYLKKALPVWEVGKACEKNYTLLFRTVIKKEKDVLLRLTGSGVYQIFINGEFVATGPARAAHGYYRVDELVLDKYLQRDENVILIQVAGYYINTFYVLEQPTFLCAELFAGDRCVAATGEGGFQARVMTERVQKVQRYSYQRPFVEVYNWSEELEKMKTCPAFSFQSVALEVQEEKKYMSRGIYYPEYETETVQRIAECGTVEVLPQPAWEYLDRSYTSINGSLHGYKPEELTFCSSQEITRQVYYPAEQKGNIREVQLSDGEYVTYAFSNNLSGTVELDVTCSDETTLYMTFDEQQEKNAYGFRLDETVNAVVWKMKAGTYHFITFEPYVMQFVRFASVGGTCVIRNVRMRRYGYPAVNRTICTDSDKLEKVFDAAIETFRQNVFDIPMDCPSRERAGWLCDSYFISRTEYVLTGKNQVERNFLENYALFSSKVLPKGMLPMCYPADFEKDPEYIPQWAMWFVLELADYYTRTRDEELVLLAKPRVDELLEYFSKYENEYGMLERLDGINLIEQSETKEYMMDVNFPTNMLYAMMLECVDELYGNEDAHKKARELKVEIYNMSYRNGFFMDQAIRTENGNLELTDNISECCQYFAFFTGVADLDNCRELWDMLVRDFGYERRESKKWPNVLFANSFIGNYLRMELLCRYGEHQRLLHDLEEYFYYMAEQTGTLWEHEDGIHSRNHGFASYVIYLLNEIGMLK